MLLLASQSDLLRVITSAAITVDVHASWADLNGTTVTPGRTNTPITTATTTTVVAAPGASTYRTVKTLTVRNRHATTVCDVTIVHTDGSNAMELIKANLPAQAVLHYHEAAGFWVTDALGRPMTTVNNNSVGAAVNGLNIVVLAADVVNNNATLNTMADVEGLSFGVTAGETYAFRFTIAYTSAATATGSRWSVNGPGSPTFLHYISQYSLTVTSTTFNSATLYDIPAACNATSLLAGNMALIDGIITPSSNGTLTARFASETANVAITAKAGSMLEWYRTL